MIKALRRSVAKFPQRLIHIVCNRLTMNSLSSHCNESCDKCTTFY